MNLVTLYIARIQNKAVAERLLLKIIDETRIKVSAFEGLPNNDTTHAMIQSAIGNTIAPYERELEIIGASVLTEAFAEIKARKQETIV